MAPIDDNAPPPVKDDGADGGTDEGAHDFWEFVAPRASPPKKNDKDASQRQEGGESQHSGGSSSANSQAQVVSASGGRMVKCQHCHKMTPVDGPTITSQQQQQHHPTTPSTDHTKTPYNTPYETDETDNNHATQPNQQTMLNNNINEDIFQTSPILDEQSYLQQQVLEAAQQMAVTASAPIFDWESKHNLFSYVGAPPKKPKKNKKGECGLGVFSIYLSICVP